MINPLSSIEAFAQKLLEYIAKSFPVACATDEFFYFPQIRLPDPKWDIWDCFSPDMMTEFGGRLSSWEDELARLSLHPFDLNDLMDVTMLRKLIRTLREQLAEVRTWETQPTFYLTLANIGLADALTSKNPAAKHERAKGLPAFLDQAAHNFRQVPVLFRDLGLEMVRDTKNYFILLGETMPELQKEMQNALESLGRFEGRLRSIPTRKDFLLPPDLVAHIFRFHIHCDLDIHDINHMLDQEIHEMEQVLCQEARHFVSDRLNRHPPNRLWLEALKSFPMPAIGKKGLIGLYSREVNRLAKHCLDKGLVPSSLVSSCPVHVAAMPSFLSAIRTAPSYSISPNHPPSGGTFYIINAHVTKETEQKYHREYRMLAAHETYPGHHLLDASRWSLARFCRRAFEQPIFYEGWACFAEELMRLTGYFSEPGDRLLLAKRRLWRAIRGKADMGLQTGKQNVSTAAGCLKETGLSMKQAMSSVRKYPLNPGYQLCYTIGLRRFLSLFDRYAHGHLQDYVRTVLSQGEIHFSDLEKILKNTNNK